MLLLVWRLEWRLYAGPNTGPHGGNGLAFTVLDLWQEAGLVGALERVSVEVGCALVVAYFAYYEVAGLGVEDDKSGGRCRRVECSGVGGTHVYSAEVEDVVQKENQRLVGQRGIAHGRTYGA